MPTTASVSAVVGRLMTHSPLARIISKLWLPPEIIRPTSDGENSRIVYHPSVMIFVLPSHFDETRTIGPGSR